MVASVLLALGLCGCGSRDLGVSPLAYVAFPHGKIEQMRIAGYRDARQIFIYLPNEYPSTSRSYPVLVVLDGESAFGDPAQSMHIDWTLDSLVAVGTVPPTIVVAIASSPGEQRDQEYIPWFGRGGDAFLAGIRDTVLPETRLRYRISSDPDSTSILGISLGGLMASYAAFSYDATFRRTAALSPGYWTDVFVSTMRARGRGDVERFYQDTGDGDDNWFAPLESIQEYARDSLGFTPGCDMKTVLAHPGDHDWNSWSHRMPSILAYLLGPPGMACSAARTAQSR